MRGLIGRTSFDPIEQHLGVLLGHPRVLSEELKLLVVQLCEVADVPFEGAHALNRSTEREVLEWIGENWDTLGETVTTIAAIPRAMSGRSRGRFTQRKGPSDQIKGTFRFVNLSLSESISMRASELYRTYCHIDDKSLM
jgi:hypothetical protein